jgi:hypothetical protein
MQSGQERRHASGSVDGIARAWIMTIMLISPRTLLRRNDKRRSLMCSAIVECRGVTRKVRVVDFSVAGLRMDGAVDLVTGDRVRVVFNSDLSVEGTIAWVVWHKTGVQLLQPLEENDPVYSYLDDQALALVRARKRAVLEVAKQHAGKPQQLDTA